MARIGGRHRRPWRRATGAILTACTFAACGDDAATKVEVPEVFDLAHDPAAEIPEIDAARTDVLPAAALRGALEDALTWHGITLVQVMRGARSDDPEVSDWIGALTANSDAITQAVGLVYGPVGARAFSQQWAQHTQFLTDYASAIGNDDEAAAAAALASLRTYAHDSGSFFSTATAGGLPADTVRGLLDTHIDHMIAMIHAAADGRDEASLDAALADNSYLTDIAGALAGGIAAQFPAVFSGPLATPDSAFCSLVRVQTGALVVSSLLTPGAPDGSVVQRAQTALADTLGAAPSEVLGPIDALRGTAAEAIAAARALLDAAGAATAP